MTNEAKLKRLRNSIKFEYDFARDCLSSARKAKERGERDLMTVDLQFVERGRLAIRRMRKEIARLTR